MKFKRLTHEAKAPERAHPFDAGLDLFADEDVIIPGRLSGGNNWATVPTGIAMGVSKGYFGKICEKSGLAQRGLSIGGGIIDSSYTSNLGIRVLNRSSRDIRLPVGEKIATLHVIKYLID